MTVKLVFDKPDGTQGELDAEALLDALWFYADPGTYFGVAIWCDPPTGGYEDDFDDNFQDDFIDREVPGKRARDFLRSLLAAGYSFPDDEEEEPDVDGAAGD